jgi:hypothetical protein
MARTKYLIGLWFVYGWIAFGSVAHAALTLPALELGVVDAASLSIPYALSPGQTSRPEPDHRSIIREAH